MNLLDLIYVPLAVVTSPVWARKARSDWAGRFGKIGRVADDASGRPRVLVHAVSVGEVNALRELVPMLAREARVIVSVGTDTGIARAREVFGKPGPDGRALAEVVRYPLDFSWAVRRFLDAVRPDVVGLVELEIWPNLVSTCVRRGVPIGVINGRLSARSFTGYRRLRWFMRRSFGRLAFAAVQDADYAERFVAMGVPEGQVTITGSMKWDAARIEDEVPGAAELGRELGIDRTRPVIVAGSTAEDEEAMLHAAVSELERRRGPIQLVCAPRKPEHFDEAAAALPGCVRRSERRAGPAGTTRFVLDTIGELRRAYALADVVVVGRSFGSLFGSDPIEPIGLGRATVMGPRASDFAQVVGAFEAGGGIARVTRESLVAELGALLDAPSRRAELARRGREVIRSQQGASERHARMLMAVCRR